MRLEKKMSEEKTMAKPFQVEKSKMGIKRQFTQVIDTMYFEVKRNYKKFILLLGFYVGIFILFYLLNETQEAQGVETPDDPEEYILTYLANIGTLIIISTAALGGAIIAEDFQKQTGNLIFPKISKNRLLTGRIIVRYGFNAIFICIYFTLIAYVTDYKYSEVPETLIESMLWALLYTFMIFTFVVFLSSINKSPSAAIVISILLLLVVAHVFEMLLFNMNLDNEPLFLITYYEKIIPASLDMPNPRYEDVSLTSREEGEFIEIRRWITPSKIDALIGMLSFAGIFLLFAYIIYMIRQSKNE